MKVKLMLDRRTFKDKPIGFKIVEIQGYRSKKDDVYHPSTLVQSEIEIEDLANGLVNGITCRPALLKVLGTTKADWLQQQVFMLDFDHATTIEEELQRCNSLNIIPVFGYTSFSHSEKEHRFRLVFIVKDTVMDVDKRNKLQCTLINIFQKSDQVAFNEDRIFFGGKGKVPIQPNYNARIDADYIINKYFDEDFIIKMQKPTKKSKKKNDKSEKTIVEKDVTHLLNLNAIKSKDADALRNLIKNGINEEPLELHSEQEVYDFINSIDLNSYLGILQGQKINCILPEHEDNTPSAHIFITKSGTPVYKCFGCDTVLTIIGLTEDLQDVHRHEAINFIKQVYNVKLVQSDWVLKQKQLMIDSANYLDTEEFKIQFPYIAKLIRTRKAHIQLMLMHLTQYVNEDLQINGKPLFFASYTTLMQVCGIKGNRNTLSQSITLFTLLNMLNKVELEHIPEEELKKAQSISAKYGFTKLTNFYQFEEYDRATLKGNNDIAKNLIEHNISIKGISREYVLRTFGKETADKTFPQYKFNNAKGTSNKSDVRTMEITQFILDNLTANGYVLEKSIKVNNKMERQWKRSIQEILDTYELIRVKANKEIKSIYNIPDTISYQSFVIVKTRG